MVHIWCNLLDKNFSANDIYLLFRLYAGKYNNVSIKNDINDNSFQIINNDKLADVTADKNYLEYIETI